jgi:hypothetical protein
MMATAEADIPAGTQDDALNMLRMANELESENPLWIVVFGTFSRQFVAFPRFTVPTGTMAVARCPRALAEKMRRVERGMRVRRTGELLTEGLLLMAAMPASPPPGINRKPEDMDTWELIIAYRHARALAKLNLSAALAKALSGWMFTVRHVLEKRGQYDKSYLHSQEGQTTLWCISGWRHQKHVGHRT